LKSEDLFRIIDLFKVQGFETPEEFFLLGYLTAHGGERYVLEHVKYDIELLYLLRSRLASTFWLDTIKDSHEIRIKICEEDIENAKKNLLSLLRKRNAKIPEWLKKEAKVL